MPAIMAPSTFFQIPVSQKINVIVFVTNHWTHSICICLSWQRKGSLGYFIALKYFPAVADILWFFTIIETQQEIKSIQVVSLHFKALKKEWICSLPQNYFIHLVYYRHVHRTLNLECFFQLMKKERKPTTCVCEKIFQNKLNNIQHLSH